MLATGIARAPCPLATNSDTALIPISHISDTAHWVAMYRALESERADPLFDDPFARRMAGELG